MSDDLNTKPMLTAILERINEVGKETDERINALSGQVKAGFSQSNIEVVQVQNRIGPIETRLDEIWDGLHRLINQILIMNQDMFELRTDQKMLTERVEKLEEDFKKKVS